MYKDTITCWIGPDEDNLESLGTFSAQNVGSSPTPYTGLIVYQYPYGYNNEQYLVIKSSTPQPFNIIGINIEVKVQN
jgi:hypothetical protein